MKTEFYCPWLLKPVLKVNLLPYLVLYRYGEMITSCLKRLILSSQCFRSRDITWALPKAQFMMTWESPRTCNLLISQVLAQQRRPQIPMTYALMFVPTPAFSQPWIIMSLSKRMTKPTPHSPLMAAPSKKPIGWSCNNTGKDKTLSFEIFPSTQYSIPKRLIRSSHKSAPVSGLNFWRWRHSGPSKSPTSQKEVGVC